MFFGHSGMKKVTKRDTIKDAVFGVPPPLSGGIFLYGRVGSGKTTAMMTLAQKYHDHPDRNYKIFDLWGGDRSEQLYWLLPSIDHTYWSKVKKKFRFTNDGPKQYKVNVIYPMSRGLPDKLPSNPPFVQSKIFTIPFADIQVEDVQLVMGVLANENKYLWKEALELCKKKDDGVVLEYQLKKLGGGKKGINKNFVAPLVREHLLQSEICSQNLDLISELKDKGTITVLCLDYIDKEYHLFIMGYILRKISRLINEGKIRSKMIGLIREAGEFFRATDQSTVDPKFKIFKTFLSEYIRLGRKGMHLFLDTQSPSESRGIVDGQQDLTIFGKLPSEADRLQATQQLFKDNLIKKTQISEMATLNKGEYFISESGQHVVKRYFFLPRTMYWREGYGNFYTNIWKNYCDKWENIEHIKESIIAANLATKQRLDELDALDAEIEQQERRDKNKNTNNDDEDSEDKFEVISDSEVSEDSEDNNENTQDNTSKVRKRTLPRRNNVQAVNTNTHSNISTNTPTNNKSNNSEQGGIDIDLW